MANSEQWFISYVRAVQIRSSLLIIRFWPGYSKTRIISGLHYFITIFRVHVSLPCESLFVPSCFMQSISMLGKTKESIPNDLNLIECISVLEI